ncbi:DUF4157 domain-containing protein [Streptomyces sp. NPDC094049]|uniref:eCIS core domain-containing protein n=1 Tax=Streptomyces sp. NPDC094049 TaxID=3154987 RepID=UPI003332104A
MDFAKDEKKKARPDSSVKQRSATSGGSAVQRLLALQSSAGNTAVVQLLRQAGHPWTPGQHQHGPACGHQGHGSEVQRSAQVEAVQRSPQGGEPAEGHEALADSSPVGQSALLDAAMASPSRSLPDSLLAEAVPFFQNPHLSTVQLHDSPVAQRATTALGAQAMTVGTHIFAPPRAVADKTVMGHELSHVNENLKGTLETGIRNAVGVTITDPNQGSERTAHRDGVSFGAGGATAPSVTAQRTPTPDAVSAAGHGHAPMADGAVQRMEEDGDRADLDDIGRRADRLARGARPFRRIPAAPPSNDVAYSSSESESESESPGMTAPGSAHQQVTDLPRHPSLNELHDLLTNELSGGGPNKKLEVTFKVDQGSAELQQAGGHAWIEIKGTGGRSTSFGFYPMDSRYRTLFGSVKGGVICPERYSRPATHWESKMVSLKDVVAGYHLVHAKAQADYSFALHNCSTFAGDVWKAMTGKAIPTEWFSTHGAISTVVANPRAFGQGLEGHQAARHEKRVAKNLTLLGDSENQAPSSGATVGIGPRVLPGAGGAMRAAVPMAGAVDEIAEQLARNRYFQNESSESSDEVD